MKYRVFLKKVSTYDFLGWYKTDFALHIGEIISLRRTIKENDNSTNENKFWRVKESIRQVRLTEKISAPQLLLFEEYFEANLIVEEMPADEIEHLFPSALF